MKHPWRYFPKQGSTIQLPLNCNLSAPKLDIAVAIQTTLLLADFAKLTARGSVRKDI